MSIIRRLQPNRLRYDPYYEFDSNNHFCPRLNKGDFYKLSGYDFSSFILKPVYTYVEDLQDYRKKYRQLSFGQKLLYCWLCFDGQVCNGGFSQLYYNGYESFVPLIIKGLEQIGDQEEAALIMKADDLYQKKRKIFSLARIQDLFDRAFHKDKLDDLDELSYQYYKINKKTLPYLEAYARQHPDEFCVDEDGRPFDPNYTGMCKTYYEDKQLNQVFTLDNGKITGEFTGYYPDGTLKEKIQFSQGMPTGEKDEYYENGQLKYSVHIDRDKDLFRHQWYFENGHPEKLEHKRTDQDELKGDYKEWHENGQLKEEGRYVGRYSREGMWPEYYADGRKKIEKEYKDGTVLIHNCWNEEGEQTLVDGTGVWIIDDKATSLSTVTEKAYKNYQQHGQQKYFRDGVIKSYTEMEEGVNHGYDRSYYRNGQVRTESVYNKGVLVSSQVFPISEHPVGKVSFTYMMEDAWMARENMPVADCYPVCTNEEEFKKTIKVPEALFDIQYQDTKSSVCVWLDIDEKGDVTNVKFQSASILSDFNGFMKQAKKMKFLPAVKEGKELASCIYIIAYFEVE